MKNSKLIIAISLFICLGLAEVKTQTLPEIQRAIDRQEYAQAVEMADKLLANDPKNDKIYSLKGTALFEQGMITEAKSAFQKGIGYNGRDPYNVIGLGSAYAKENNFAEAKANFDKATELNKTNSVDILIAIADGYLNSEKREFLDEAEKILYKVNALDKSNVNAFISLGDLYLKQRINDLALVNYQEAIKLDPTFIKGYLRVGQLQVKAKKYPEGAEMFQKAIATDPTFAPAYKELGELWYLAGKFEKAKENYRKYVEMTKNDVAARQRYASFLFLTQDYKTAISEMEQVLVESKGSIIPYRILGYCYTEMKDADKALENFEKYFSMMKPEGLLMEDFEYRGKAYILKGETEKAITELRKAMEKDPTKTGLFQVIAEIQYDKKDYLNAAASYTSFFQTGTAKFKDLFQLANCYYFLNDTIQADTAFATLIERYPATHVGHLYRGRVKFWSDPKSELGLSKPFYEKAYEILILKADATAREKKDLLEAAQYLGFYYYLHGQDCVNAAPYWKKVLELDPENQGAKDVLKFCKL